MHTNLEVSPRSFISNLPSECKAKLVSLKQRARRVRSSMPARWQLSSDSVRKLLPLSAIVAGGVACALWLDSGAAGAFALVLLFLLFSIGKSLEHIAAHLTAHSTVHADRRVSGGAAGSHIDVYVSGSAMERLRSWVEDESSLSEEGAKAYCSVLLNTVAMLQPMLAERTPAESSERAGKAGRNSHA